MIYLRRTNICVIIIFAFIAGFVLDLLIGDPHFIPHPVRLIGSLISFLDKRLNCDAGYNISGKKIKFNKI